jgi:hypothetical protein
MSLTSSPARRSLADLNVGFVRTGATADFDTLTEYRVGKWGLAWSRDGYGARGLGGDHLHLSVVTVITAIHPDYDWRPYCAASAYLGYGTEQQKAARRDRQVAGHGSYNHHCNQPKVGDAIAIRPVCRDQNVRGTFVFDGATADTNLVDCINCRRNFFGEQVDVVAVKADRTAAVEARKAAKPLPTRCFHCGDLRPKTKATADGEQLPCSNCRENFETIWWVETTGFSCQYFAESGAAHLREAGLADETAACERLERVEEKWFR